ncbi:DUF2513 domain-containing protein [Enterococcus avium]|uniref:DUF2513 domain-containing protein n=1 Tax=Enterococcus avium TaxID=33945 RepID=UPI00288E7F71|nr:DUF2513 domain-containing protein [Enterococcus avium]MDT2485041.1 DUF2513 domain-containing protein [Enterococcus avium]MDT2511627.1 DUF2513 domain-containing protein [Enterococcus avium]
MKLNQDCVRDIMLLIEDEISFGSFLRLNYFLESKKLSKYDRETIKYTLGKLDETGFLKSNTRWVSNDLVDFSTGMPTWKGHEFLDTIRDNTVWKNTKSIVSKFSSVSISMVENIASNVITQLINKHLDV